MWAPIPASSPRSCSGVRPERICSALADLVGMALATGLTLTRLEEPGTDDYPFLIALQLQRS
jgi:hypothetical protein